MRVLATSALAFAAILTTASATAPPSAAVTGLRMQACKQGKHGTAAECGTFGVYENRATRAGRVIKLSVVVLKAKHPSHDAIAYIEGGPGVGAVADAPYIADGDDPVLAAFKDQYDIVFVDNRGMGSSNPTHCNVSPYSDMAAYFLQTWPTAVLKACYQRYGATSDPSAYNTNNAVDDVDDVRAALGYHKVLLYGGSYGSFFSLVYLRRHPEQSLGAALEGILAPHFTSLPGAPDAAQTALDDIIRKCANDAGCRKNFPDFKAHFYAVLGRFQRGPLTIVVRNPKSKRTQTVRLSKGVFVDRVREDLYAPETAAYLPYVIERAYRDDYVPLGRMIDLWSQFLAQGQDPGTNLAYRCADLDPFISESELQTAAQHSFASDIRVRDEQNACDIWKVAPMPASFNDPVRSNAPILMIEGSDDPVTPPKYAQAALAYLPNARLVVVRGGGHGVDIPCVTRLQIAFIRTGTAKHLDLASCAAAFKTPPFATSMKGWQDWQ